ncbi:MAG TPA: histidine kinase [Gemmatimonadales bacterium]
MPKTDTLPPTDAAIRPPLWQEALLVVAFWAFFALLTAANRLLDPRGPGIFGGTVISPALTLALVSAGLWALLTPLVFFATGRLSAERAGWLRRIVVLALLGLVASIFVDVMTDLARDHLFPRPRRRGPIGFDPVRSFRRLWFLDDLVVYVAVMAAGFARSFFYRFRARQAEAVRLQAEAARLQAQLAEARLSALRTQLNPHFLFNTLHAVSSLVERDPRGVRRMIARLSELLRHTLDGSSEQEVPLEQELAFLDRYLEIMRIRFQGRLEVETRVEPEAETALIPNLLLQPLLENALEHGASRVEGIGRVELDARVEGGRLVVRVRDNGPGIQGTPPDEGVGLRNTRQRLEQLYGAEQHLRLTPAEGGGLVAEISLPYHTASDLRAAAVPAGA